jgi:hypothetical protein
MIRLGRLSKAAKNIALGKHLEIYIPYVREVFPEVIAEGLTEEDWHDLKLMINSRSSTDCQNIIIQNVGILNFLETFFRLRVFDWEEKEVDSFLKPLENSLLPSLTTLLKLRYLSKKKVRGWDETVSQEEFRSVKVLLQNRCLQNWLIKSFSRALKWLILSLILIVLIFTIWILTHDLSVIERFLSLMGAIASIVSLSYILVKRG